MVGSPSQRFETGQEALPVVRDELGGPPGGRERVKRPSWWSRTGWEALPEVRDGSKGPPEGPGQV